MKKRFHEGRIDEMGSDKKNLFKKRIKTLIDRGAQINAFKESLLVSFYYGLFGFSWIFITDRLLDWLVEDPILYKQAQLVKGWLYIIITIFFLFWIVKRRIDILKDFVQDMAATNRVLDKTEEELYLQRAFTDEIIGSAPIMIVIWDTSGNLKSVNPYTLEVLGYNPDSIFYQEWLELLFSTQNKEAMVNVYEAIRRLERLENFETKLVGKDNKDIYVIWNSGVLQNKEPGKKEYVSFGINVTEKKFAEVKLRNLAYFDVLTGLPNRISIKEEVDRKSASGRHFALLYFDIDNFKYINDSLGHPVGDELLTHIGGSLRKIIKTPHIVSRLGGDEFAVIVENPPSKDAIITLTETIKHEVGKSWYIYNHNFYVSFSIGVAISPQDGLDFDTLSKHAEIAMYHSKKNGKGRVTFFQSSLEENTLHHIEMAKKMQKAIEHADFELYYQPLYQLSTKAVSGMEALIRWKESTQGFIPPGIFIPLAEETGQIFEIEQWVFKQALRQRKIWDDEGLGHLNLSINLSSKTLMSDTHFASIEQELIRNGGNPSGVMIEITETAIIHDLDLVIKRLERLRQLGTKIALDDFGTGYSSLTHIKTLPIDVIKLDRNFISQIQNKGKDETIVHSVIELVKKLGYKLVAEGIETESQYRYLNLKGCEFGQGYLMSKPLPIQQINQLLDNEKSKA